MGIGGEAWSKPLHFVTLAYLQNLFCVWGSGVQVLTDLSGRTLLTLGGPPAGWSAAREWGIGESEGGREESLLSPHTTEPSVTNRSPQDTRASPEWRQPGRHETLVQGRQFSWSSPAHSGQLQLLQLVLMLLENKQNGFGSVFTYCIKKCFHLSLPFMRLKNLHLNHWAAVLPPHTPSVSPFFILLELVWPSCWGFVVLTFNSPSFIWLPVFSLWFLFSNLSFCSVLFHNILLLPSFL